MTLTNGTWYDNQGNYKYGDHEFALSPNDSGIDIMKCIRCKQSRMFLQVMDMTSCKSVGVGS